MVKSRYENIDVTKVRNGKQTITSLNADINREINFDNIRFKVIKYDSSKRLDQIAHEHLGSSQYFWLIMKLNNLWNFWRIAPGSNLIIPERESLKELLDHF